MVHLKTHFSVRAEYKKKTQRKALTIQCGHLCTHTKLCLTHNWTLHLRSSWPHKDDYTHTDISMTPGCFFLWLQAFDPSYFDARLHNTSHFELAHRMHSDMIIPFIRWCNSTDMLFRVGWACLFLSQRDTKLLSSLFIPFIWLMHKNCTKLYGSEPLRIITLIWNAVIKSY